MLPIKLARMLGIGLLLQAGQSFALNCYETSSWRESMGDAYFERGPSVQLDESQSNWVASLLAATEGDWTGHLTEKTCAGSDRDPTVNTRAFETDVNIERNGLGELKLTLRKPELMRGLITGDHLFLFTDQAVFLYQQIDNGFEVGEKYRTNNRFYEKRIQLLLKGDHLFIDIHYYLNGVFNGTVTVSLRKD